MSPTLGDYLRIIGWLLLIVTGVVAVAQGQYVVAMLAWGIALMECA